MAFGPIEFRAGNLHLPELGLWLDPHEPQLGSELVFVSHAHSDHVAAHREVIGKYHEITAAYDDVVNLEVVRWRTALGRLRHRLRLDRK